MQNSSNLDKRYNRIDTRAEGLLPPPAYAQAVYSAQYNGMNYSYPSYPQGFAPNFYGYVAPQMPPSIMLQGNHFTPFPAGYMQPNGLLMQPYYYPQQQYVPFMPVARQTPRQNTPVSATITTPSQPNQATIQKSAGTDANWRKTSAEKVTTTQPAPKSADTDTNWRKTSAEKLATTQPAPKSADTDTNWRKTSAENIQKLSTSPQVRRVSQITASISSEKKADQVSSSAPKAGTVKISFAEMLKSTPKMPGQAEKALQTSAPTPLIKASAKTSTASSQALLIPNGPKPQAPSTASFSSEKKADAVSSSAPKAGTVKISFAEMLMSTPKMPGQAEAAFGMASSAILGADIPADVISSFIRGGAVKTSTPKIQVEEKSGPMAKDPEASFEKFMNLWVATQGYGDGIPVRNKKKADKVLHKPPQEVLQNLPKAKKEIGHSRKEPFLVQVLAPCRVKTTNPNVISSIADKGVLELGLKNSGEPGHLFYNQANTPEKLKEYRRLKGKKEPRQPKASNPPGQYTCVSKNTPFAEDNERMHFYQDGGRQWTLYKKNPTKPAVTATVNNS